MLDHNVREMLTDNNGVCQPLRVMCSFYVKEKEKETGMKMRIMIYELYPAYPACMEPTMLHCLLDQGGKKETFSILKLR